MRTGECTSGCGACCRFLRLQVNPQYLEVADARHWIELHGIRLDRGEEGATWAHIPLACSALTEEGLCGLYGTPERPLTCETFPTSQADIDRVNAAAGEAVCSYAFV